MRPQTISNLFAGSALTFGATGLEMLNIGRADGVVPIVLGMASAVVSIIGARLADTGAEEVKVDSFDADFVDLPNETHLYFPDLDDPRSRADVVAGSALTFLLMAESFLSAGNQEGYIHLALGVAVGVAAVWQYRRALSGTEEDIDSIPRTLIADLLEQDPNESDDHTPS